MSASTIAGALGRRVLPGSSAIIVHGGAGHTDVARFERLRAGVRAAAEAGDAILSAGGSALDAVVAAVRVLEDDPEFNAGIGSALTRDGTVETDASVMDGESQRVGAVAAVPDLGCAIALARAVLDRGEHVMLAGPSAWRFAAEVGIAPAPAGALVTERARARLAEINRQDASREGGVTGRVPEINRQDAKDAKGRSGEEGSGGSRGSGGTVGAVARDRAGRFAAATSTGGIAGKRAGRVGDSPVPGAGTWADARVAISATGDGEAILRVALARAIAARLAAGIDLRAAVAESLAELHRVTGGTAGAIAVDADGVVGLQLTDAMPVASIVRGERAGGIGERADGMGESLRF